jgi:N-ethylmaleimide reductase
MTASSLFSPLRLGAITLEHRIVMPPLTRMRSAQPGDVPQAMNAIYYGQRATQGGLLIAEATDISAEAHGYPGAPGIYSPAQIAGWKAVTDAVHAKGGFIFDQIWHTGRISHSSLRGGKVPVAPSAIAAPGSHFDVNFQSVALEMPRALELAEIKAIVGDFRQAVLNARAAGFDGVEIHCANGYLINQFLEDGTNHRTDVYGGSIENRARLLLEVVDVAIKTWSADRVGVRLSPFSAVHGMSDSNPGALYDYVVGELGKRRIAYVHTIEPRSGKETGMASSAVAARIRAAFHGPVIVASSFDQSSAEAALARGDADAVAFGRFFIANPDLVERFRRGAALNAHDRASFYGGTEKGYTDYPFLAQ